MTRNKRIIALVCCALLVSVEIVFSRFLSIPTSVVKISLGLISLSLAGILFGAGDGFVGGLLLDLLGVLLFPIGAHLPGFIPVSALWGVA